jgi:hypothetical protein
MAASDRQHLVAFAPSDSSAELARRCRRGIGRFGYSPFRSNSVIIGMRGAVSGEE